ncbi:alpha/beta hydrolase family protein [Amphibacillus sediminis]|uniref:alpha/beta hydrolase family protein n=1 Tax=Amphibacillus sediminis TaxID=360185 RepID=UPI000834BC0A
MKTYNKKVVKIKHHGRTIYGVSYMPENTKKCPVVIFCHGFNGTNKDFAMHSEYLALNGIASFCFDFCGGSVNSNSDLSTTEMSLFTEKEDLCAVIEYIKQWDLIDSHHIFLFGGSQGRAVVALVAEEYKEDIKGILLLFPAFCIPDNWNEVFPTLDSIPDTHEVWGVPLGRVYFETIHGFDIFNHIGKFDKDILIFHGDQDEIVPLMYGEKAAKIYPNAEIEIFQGEGHGFSEPGNRRVIMMTHEFVKSNS